MNETEEIFFKIIKKETLKTKDIFKTKYPQKMTAQEILEECGV
jgi:hypothetical protein